MQVRIKQKIRIKIKPTVRVKIKSPVKVPGQLREYSYKMGNAFKNKDDDSYICEVFRKEFGLLPERPFPLIRLKLYYHLFKKSTPTEVWDKKSDKVKQNYEAAMAMNPNGLESGMKNIIKQELMEDNMAVKVKAEKKVVAKEKIEKSKSPEQKKLFGGTKGKTQGLTIRNSWIYGLRKEMSDKELVQFMRKEYPNRPTNWDQYLSHKRKKFEKGGYDKVKL